MDRVDLAGRLSAAGVLWDRDTLKDEKRGLPEMVNLLAGRWEKHSTFFYEHRVAAMKKLLEKDPKNWDAWDNLAVAYEKLDDREHAIAAMLEKEKLNPGQYTTYANLGTFYLHAGDLERGIEFIKKALVINPNAHFGREEYQLKIAEYYLAAKTKPELLTTQDFLGAENRQFYNRRNENGEYVWLTPGGNDLVEVRIKPNVVEGISGMIRFGTGKSAELYFVLGEILHAQRKHFLAYRAYLRAVELDHPRKEYIQEQINNMLEGTRSEEDPNGYDMALIQKERAAADAWVKAYQDFEDNLLRSGRDTDSESNYKEFYAAHPIIDAATLDGGSITKPWFSPRTVHPAIIVGALAIAGLFTYEILRRLWIRKSSRHTSDPPK